MIISVTSLKGGTGKSTISQNLAVCFAHAGYKVAIVDTDSNANSVHWSGIRDENLPSVAVFGIPDSNALIKNTQKLNKDYEMVIIDGTPSLSKLASTIIALGDLVLIPIRPSGLDIWATEKFLEKYEQAKVMKGDIKAFFVLNQFNDKILVNRESKEALEEFDIVPLKTTLKTRVAYVESVIEGKGVYEYKNPKAKQEMIALSNEVMNIIQQI